MNTDIAGLVLAVAILAIVMTAARIGIRLQERKQEDDNKGTTDEPRQDD